MTKGIRNFRELKVYQKAFVLQQRIFEISRRFPSEEKYSLTDQIRRASRAVGSNTAEGWQKRRYVAHFVSKLSDADGEQAEAQHWLDTSMACAYISPEEHEELIQGYAEVGRMLGAMMQEPEQWCRRMME